MNPAAFYRALRGLSGNGFQSREELEAYQGTLLRRLVAHAYERVPYYKRLLTRAGVSPRDIRSVKDLRLIPATARGDIQMLPEREVCAQGMMQLMKYSTHTSGSSASPLVVHRTWAEENLMLAYRARAVAEWGYGLGTKRANIDHVSPDAIDRGAKPRLYEKIGLLRRLNLDWKLPRGEILDRLEAFEPQLLSAPASLLADLADVLSEHDRERISATRIITGSETLTSTLRQRIEQGFKIPVTDLYGCVETIFIAMESPQAEGYKICGESVIVEVVDQDEPADRGEIIVTSLHQWGMPFIRYRLGDLVERINGPGPNDWLKSIDGRVTDRFLLSDGRVLHGYTLGELIEKHDARVRQFQITQLERNKFLFQLVLEDKNNPDLPGLEVACQAVLGAGTEVIFQCVETLDRATRKFYPYISLERLKSTQNG